MELNEMPKPVNDTNEFFKKLESDGKVTNLNNPEHYQAIKEVNKTMEECNQYINNMRNYTIK